MLLAIARLPARPDAFAEAARRTGIALADVKQRLTGPLPRPLLLDTDGERLRGLAGALEEAGFGALVCDPRTVPGDDDRLLARGVAVDGDGVTITDGLGNEERCPAHALGLIQRGLRAHTTKEVTKTTTRQIDVGRALLTGGLLLTKKVTTEGTRATKTEEPFLLLHREDGERDIILYERRLDYRGLGGRLEPSSLANFQRLLGLLRATAPGVPYDDRVARPGVVEALRQTGGDPVDLGLFLVRLAHLRGFA